MSRRAKSPSAWVREVALAHRRHRALDLGHLYVVAFEPDVIKVGRASNPSGRLQAHARAGLIRTSWVSEQHLGCSKTEKALIAFCRQRGELHGGKEYFRGVQFSTIRDYADLLVLCNLNRQQWTESAAVLAQLEKSLSVMTDGAAGDDSVSAVEAWRRGCDDNA